MRGNKGYDSRETSRALMCITVVTLQNTHPVSCYLNALRLKSL